MKLTAWIKRHFLPVCLTIIFVLAVGFSLRLLVADMFYNQAQQLIIEAQSSAQPSLQQKYLKQSQRFLRTATWLTRKPSYLELKASVLVWQAGKQSPVASHKIHRAIVLYHESLELRPNSPYPWLGIIEAKLTSQQFDDELQQAIKKAEVLGFNDAVTQKQLLLLTLPHHPRLPLVSQQQLLITYQKALRTMDNAKDLVKLGQKTGLFLRFCKQEQAQLITLNKQLQQLCSEELTNNKKGS